MPRMSELGAPIFDVTVSNFEREVLVRSMETPVLVDFWATWCGPCKALTPLLEARAREGGGRFVLAKVDIDANPELAQAFRVQAVPTVLAVVGGRPVDGFQGGLPAEELDRFLDRIAPADGGDPLQEEIDLLLSEGRREEAMAMLREVREADPEHLPALFGLAELLLEDGALEEARTVFADLPEEARGSERAQALAARLAFSAASDEVRELEQRLAAEPNDIEARVALAKALAASGESERGLELLLEVVRNDPAGQGPRARAGMLEIFELLGLEDPVANDYRFKLSLELFA